MAGRSQQGANDVPLNFLDSFMPAQLMLRFGLFTTSTDADGTIRKVFLFLFSRFARSCEMLALRVF